MPSGRGEPARTVDRSPERSVTDPTRDHALDHLVVLMFENRSFDNLLGYLYDPGEVASFEGVAGRQLSNPLPAELANAGPRSVPVHPALSMDLPDPNPGEEFPHVNTQMFSTVDPPGNASASIDRMQPPFNAPSDPNRVATMDGFVADYVREYRQQLDRLPTVEQCSQIMACYPRDRVPVLSTLARGFAVFDHWFCEAPTETYPNRSFLHAASSSGFVLNHPPGKFEAENDAPTVFERLEAAQRSWHVYIDPAQIVPATALIHARRLAPYFADHFSTLFDFEDDAREGRLPEYSFLEPNMFLPHSDMHPPGAARFRERIHAPPPEAMLRGEQLLARVYGPVRGATTAAGSNWANTLLLVLFDEHGGTYDHVPPPSVPPPGDTERAEMGFDFARSGLRVPAVAVSPWIDAGTVVTSEFRHTSVIRTLRNRWGLGPPLTARDATAADLAPVLTRSTPRVPDSWPVVAPMRPSLLDRAEEILDRPLSRLERDLLGEALSLEATRTGHVPAADPEVVGRREARGHLTRIQAAYFPGVARGRST